jgi:hypothetical protein
MEGLRGLQSANGGFSQVKLDPRWGTIRRVGGGFAAVPGNTAEEKARTFLARHGGAFGVPSDLNGLQLVNHRKDVIGDHVVFNQTVAGIPVIDAAVGVHIDPRGRVYMVNNSYRPRLNPRVGPMITRARAMDSVNAFLKRSPRPGDAPRIQWCIHATPEVQTQAWEIWFTPRDVAGSWHFVVDALDASLIVAEDRIQHQGVGFARVFDPNPIKTLDNSTAQPFSAGISPRRYGDYPDSGDLDIFTGNPFASRSYFEVIMTDLTVDPVTLTATLDGPNVRVTPTSLPPFAPVLPNTYNYRFDRFSGGGPNGFEEVMAYYHINTFRKFLLDPAVNLPADTRNRLFPFLVGLFQMEVQVNDTATNPANNVSGECCVTGLEPSCAPTRTFNTVPVGQCNQSYGFYDPASPSLHFGPGGRSNLAGVFITQGVDVAEDADMILHEFGHALQDAAIVNPPRCCVPNLADPVGQRADSVAMAEGFGDYQAAWWAEFRGKAGRDAATVGAWTNAPPVAGAPGGGPLRRLDGDINYADDSTCGAACDDRHSRGQIWAAALWDIKQRVGYRIANRAIYTHHSLRAGDDNMVDAANLMIVAHAVADGGFAAEEFRRAFRQRGIPVSIFPAPFPPAVPAVAPTLQAAGTRTLSPKTIRVEFNVPLDAEHLRTGRVHNGVSVINAACAGESRNVTVFSAAPYVPHDVLSLAQVFDPVTPTRGVVILTLRDSMGTGETPTVRVLEASAVDGSRQGCQSVVASDGAPPRIVSAAKLGSTQIVITFSETMSGALFTQTSFRFSGRHVATGPPVVAGATATYTITPNLRTSERVIVVLRSPVSDLAGNRLNPGAPPVVTPP